MSFVIDAILHPYSDFIMHPCKNPLKTPYPGWRVVHFCHMTSFLQKKIYEKYGNTD